MLGAESNCDAYAQSALTPDAETRATAAAVIVAAVSEAIAVTVPTITPAEVFTIAPICNSVKKAEPVADKAVPPKETINALPVNDRF